MKKRLLGQTFRNGYRNLLRHPKWRWWVILGSLLYLVSPIDISPDVFPVLGWVDDGLIATLAITEISQMLLERRQLGRKSDAAAAQKTTVNASRNTSENVSEMVIDVPSVTVG
ncbi:MAG TPA: YkvA family protein [Trichocoleus sp.]